MGRQVVVQGYNEDEIKKRNYRGHHKTEYRIEALRAAEQLCYGDKVYNMIKNAETDRDIERIMHDARLGLMK